jgi:hypothetical protein
MGQEILSYDSICMLVGKLILQNYLQTEQLGKTVTEAQKRYNDEHEQVVRLRQELTRLRSLVEQPADDDAAGKRANNQ